MEQEPRLTTVDDAPSTTSTADRLSNLVVWTQTTMLDDVDPAGQSENNVVRGVD